MPFMNLFLEKNNLWANDQLVTFLYFKNDINQFNSECKSIFNIYYDKEISAIKNKILNTSNRAYNKRIYESFQVKTIIPNEYSQSFDAEDQMLFSYNPQNKDVIKHILRGFIETTLTSFIAFWYISLETLLWLRMSPRMSF